MKTDLIKFLALIWMCGTAYLMYEMSNDLKYMCDLISAYMQMVMDHIRH